jgi:hypothetical protein
LADARTTHDALAPTREATQLAIAETAPATPAEDADTPLEELMADPAESRAAKPAAAELPAAAAPPPAPRSEVASRRLSPTPRPAASPAPVVAAPAPVVAAPAPVVAAPAPPAAAVPAVGLAAEPAAGQAVLADAADLAPAATVPAPRMAKSAALATEPPPELSVSLVLPPAEARRKDVVAGASRALTQDVAAAAPAAAGPPVALVAPILTALYGRHPQEPDAALVRVVAEAGPGAAPLPLRLELLVPPAAGREVVLVARWAAPGRAVLVARVRPAALAAQATARVVPQPGEAEFAVREVACQAAADDDAGFRADLTHAELRARAQGR